MDDALEIRNLRKEYPGFTLRDISFTLPRGYIMGLIGPNGAGKTTVVKLILNIVRRNGGTVSVFGLDNLADESEVKSRIGFVLDEPPFYGYLRAADMARVVASFYRTWDGPLFLRLCREFEGPVDRRVHALSRGTRMKLALAIALSHRAELIVMDEPTSGLDPVFRRELLERLSGLIVDGRSSVLFSTHITADLERVADYLTCLRRGELLFSATRDEVLENWGLVKGGAEPPEALSRGLFKGIRRTAHGFTALTPDMGEARRRLAGCGMVVEAAGLDDLVFFLGREAGAGKETAGQAARAAAGVEDERGRS
jgi:ABC-2 type transport system ATP-binding protein